MNNEHDYSTPMETANASSNKRDRMSTTPANTQEKSHTEKKPKVTPQENDSNTSTDTILKAIDTLGKRVVDRMEEISKQLTHTVYTHTNTHRKAFYAHSTRHTG